MHVIWFPFIDEETEPEESHALIMDETGISIQI